MTAQTEMSPPLGSRETRGERIAVTVMSGEERPTTVQMPAFPGTELITHLYKTSSTSWAPCLCVNVTTLWPHGSYLEFKWHGRKQWKTFILLLSWLFVVWTDHLYMYFVGAYKNAILIMVDIFASGINKRLCFNYKKVMHSKKQISSAS